MIRTAGSFAAILLVACAPGNEYEIRIDASALEDQAARAVAYGYLPGEDDYGELASVELQNGRAILSGIVDYVRIVQIDVLPADDIYPLGRAEFVLEPGLTTVRFLADSNEVEGGEYTQLAFDSWRGDPEYSAADEERRARFDAMAAMSEEEREEREASFLVSTDGVTVGRNLRGNDLQLRLEELFREAAAKAAAAEAEPTETSSEEAVE